MKENQTSFQNGLLTTLPTISQTRRTQKSLHSLLKKNWNAGGLLPIKTFVISQKAIIVTITALTSSK